jgi:hypothetical protein
MDQGIIASMKLHNWDDFLRTLVNEDGSIIALWGKKKILYWMLYIAYLKHGLL